MKKKKRLIKCLVLSFVLLSILASLVIPSFASSDEPPMFSVRPVDDGYSVPGSIPVVTTYNLSLPTDGGIDPYYSSSYALIVDPLFNSKVFYGYTDMTQITDGISNFEVVTSYYDYDFDRDLVQYIPADGSVGGCSFYTRFDYLVGYCDSIDMEARDFYVDTNGVDPAADYYSQVQLTMNREIEADDSLDVYVSYVKAGDLNDGLNRMVYETRLSYGDFSSIELVPDAFIESLDDGLYYIEYIKVSLNIATSIADENIDYTYAVFFDDFRDRDILSHITPETPMDPGIFADYTSWIGTAVGGFIDLEIVQGFTLGGILMTIIGFLIAIWFLKLLAGG